MDYIAILKVNLDKGYSKSDLERLIGLPQNCLSGVIKGDKKLSKKSELKIEKWEVSDKPHPLQLEFHKKFMAKAEEQWAQEGEALATAAKELKNGTATTKGIIPQITTDYELKTAKDRIEQLQKELKTIPTTLKIPKRMYISIREKELSELKIKYNQ